MYRLYCPACALETLAEDLDDAMDVQASHRDEHGHHVRAEWIGPENEEIPTTRDVEEIKPEKR